ncbi:uncharacterized protein [Eucyclogobius newberryi]|uniref:uncharacterized protein n=1 Tax=Eucyclogobius newberryi TaxID=166745 RepID=UPI003B5A18A5
MYSLSFCSIPKPTDINMGEKILKVPTPKEHPYASHIPRYSMFPSYSSSVCDVHGTEPNSAPDVTLLSKTKGNAYRHELLKPPTRTKKAVTWAEEHAGFLEYPKTLKGKSQVFYPTPTTLVRPKLKHDLVPSSDETRKMLENQERTHWITSYQMHYSGYEKGHLKMDFRQKHIRPSGRNAHTAPQRDKPTMAFVSSTLTDDYKRTDDVSAGTTDPTARPRATFPAPLHRPTSAAALPQRPRQNSVNCNEELGPNQRGHSPPEHSGDDLPHGASHRQQSGGFEREEHGSQTQENVRDTERPLQDGELMRLNPCVLPRPPVLPGIRPLSGEGQSLKELQDSFSKTQVHHRVNSSTTRTPVNPRDNVCTGRRHDFYGVNAFFLHG